MLVIPSVAIHMDRSVNQHKEWKVQKDMLPLYGMTGAKTPFMDVTAAAAEVKVADAVVDVLTINGVVVRKGVKASEALRGLKRGLYIVGGEKRVVNE